MKISAQLSTPAPAPQWRVRDAWTAFWQEPGQSRCVAGAPETWRSLTQHWNSFGQSLASGTRVLDLGCGAGALSRLILDARPDVNLTGIDFARVPLSMRSNLELLSETAMESTPFSDESFGAVVSQFGFEYSETTHAAREMARVAAPGGRFSFLVHHSHSAIVNANRSRLGVLAGFVAPAMRSAFCAGDTPAFLAHLSELKMRYPADSLLADLAQSLPSRLARASRERNAIWKAIEEALAPERCLAGALDASCVAPAALAEWLAPLSMVGVLDPPAVLREPDGTPIAWKLAGTLL